MEPENLTLKVLIDIREEMRGFREEVRGVRDEQRETNVRLAAVEHSVVETNTRLAAVEQTVLKAATQIRVLARATRTAVETKRVHEERFEELERRVTDLERGRS